jgi:NADH:ubiquinone oxidoreductase subunit 4 (subunit M)
MSTTEPVTVTVETPRRRTHTVLGAISGLLLGVFVAIDLVLFGVIAFESGLVWLFPVLGLVLGIVVGRTSPFGTRHRT